NEAPVGDPVDFVRLARTLKKYASDRADVAIAPTLKASPDNHFSDWRVFSAALGGMANSMFMLKAIMLIVILLGLFLFPAAGIGALVIFHAQVLVAFAGTKMHPRDLVRTLFLRTPFELLSWFRLLRTRLRVPQTLVNSVNARRPFYQEALVAGAAGLFEERRQNCPVCASTALKTWLRSPDIIQRKPGRFILDRCSDCGHVFQNPKLTAAGLNFYYADFYDGLGAESLETMFRARPKVYEERAAVIRGLAAPQRWLDVGT